MPGSPGINMSNLGTTLFSSRLKISDDIFPSIRDFLITVASLGLHPDHGVDVVGWLGWLTGKASGDSGAVSKLRVKAIGDWGSRS